MRINGTTLINWSIEFGPIILFFIALGLFGHTTEGFVGSTALFTVATIITLVASYIREKRIALFPIVAGASIIFFGFGTVFFNDPIIFIVKDSIYNGLFAIVLLIGLVQGKGYLKLFFSTLFDMQDEGWRILSFRWMIMFILLAVSNELIWRLCSQNVWVYYKFISTVITTVFGFYQIVLAKRFRNPTASTWGMRTQIASKEMPGIQ